LTDRLIACLRGGAPLRHCDQLRRPDPRWRVQFWLPQKAARQPWMRISSGPVVINWPSTTTRPPCAPQL
jgi:hypothetical protein